LKGVELFVAKLSSLKEGDLSILRGLGGSPLDADLRGFDLFTGIWWPVRANHADTPRRNVAWLVSKLYAFSPLPHIGTGESLASCLGRCECELLDERERKRFRTCFDSLLATPLEGLEFPLRWALGVISDASIGKIPYRGIDWVRLIDDLSIWDRGVHHRKKRDIREIWAEDYFAAVSRERRKRHARGSSHDSEPQPGQPQQG